MRRTDAKVKPALSAGLAGTATRFPRGIFSTAVVLTVAALVWLGWIAWGSFAMARASASQVEKLDAVSERIAALRGASGERERAVLERTLTEAVHLLARVEGSVSGAAAPPGTAWLRETDVSQSVPWMQAALSTAEDGFRLRAESATRRAWAHLVGSAGIFGALLFAWLALTQSLQRSRTALLAEIEERIRIGAELERARDSALESARLKSAFIHNMSHEVRTPLSVILGNATSLGDRLMERGDAEASPILEAVERAGRRLLETVDGIMDLAKLESGGFEVSPRELGLASCVRGVAAGFERRAQEKGVSLSLTIEDPAAHAVVSFDSRCLEGALTKLLDNAIKFTEAGSVDVRLSRDREGVLRLEVCDTGIGIGESYADHAFEPFSQEDSGTSRRFEGAGIGLALARGYVEANGASIDVRSSRGRGSTFRIRFPPALEIPGRHAE